MQKHIYIPARDGGPYYHVHICLLVGVERWAASASAHTRRNRICTSQHKHVVQSKWHSMWGATALSRPAGSRAVAPVSPSVRRQRGKRRGWEKGESAFSHVPTYLAASRRITRQYACPLPSRASLGVRYTYIWAREAVNPTLHGYVGRNEGGLEWQSLALGLGTWKIGLVLLARAEEEMEYWVA
jgi:hypothetical protein